MHCQQSYISQDEGRATVRSTGQSLVLSIQPGLAIGDFARGFNVRAKRARQPGETGTSVVVAATALGIIPDASPPVWPRPGWHLER